MAGVNGHSLKPAAPAPRVHGAHHRMLVGYLLCAIAVTAITAVVIAVAMGQTTVAFVIGLLTGAVFAGMLC